MVRAYTSHITPHRPRRASGARLPPPQNAIAPALHYFSERQGEKNSEADQVVARSPDLATRLTAGLSPERRGNTYSPARGGGRRAATNCESSGNAHAGRKAALLLVDDGGGLVRTATRPALHLRAPFSLVDPAWAVNCLNQLVKLLLNPFQVPLDGP
jgi:hypothetical protein